MFLVINNVNYLFLKRNSDCKITKKSLINKYFRQKNCIFSKKNHFFVNLVHFLCAYSIKK